MRDSMNKPSRHFAIKEIIAQKQVSSQEELCEELRRSGFEVTQATLSRDLKELGIARIHSESGTRYTLHDEAKEKKLKSFIGYEIESISSNESLIIIKTLPGFASGVAEFIDSLHHSDILGTIAGDNTIMVTPTSIKKTHSVAAFLREAMMEQATTSQPVVK
jgi:transcriptional regulator of arginine metabolism